MATFKLINVRRYRPLSNYGKSLKDPLRVSMCIHLEEMKFFEYYIGT